MSEPGFKPGFKPCEVTATCVDCGADFAYIKTYLQSRVRLRCEKCTKLRKKLLNKGKDYHKCKKDEEADIDIDATVTMPRKKKNANPFYGIDKIQELAEQHHLSYGKMRALLRRERMKMEDELRLRCMREAANGGTV